MTSIILDSDKYDAKTVSEKPEIFKEFNMGTDLNAKFDGLDIDEFFEFISSQVQAAGDDLQDK